MKGKPTHLVDVPRTSNHSELDYFNEHGDPLYVHACVVSVKELNCKKHLIQFPISVDFKKVRNSEDCPTVLFKADMGGDVNLMNPNTFNKLIKDQTVLKPTSLKWKIMEIIQQSLF